MPAASCAQYMFVWQFQAVVAWQLTNGRVAEHYDAGAEGFGLGQLQIQSITNSPQ
ncbi:hypothetical protein [Paenibacillus lautus]|uniref:hypothetical protein n=1 Tax=Paenibacillus lautus TaxID=1401 RepID=UPI003D27257A